jgi:gluconokinase
MSFGEYFYLKIFNRALVSVSMASGTGLMNIITCDWDAEMLQAIGIKPENLSPIAADDRMPVGLNREYAGRWPALAQVPWLPEVGDGAMNNIGSGCVTRERAALMVGTSGAMRVCWKTDRVRVPRGLWCYRATRDYVVMGGALSDGGSAFEWCRRILRLESAEDKRSREEKHSIEKRLARLEPDGHGLTVLPFFSGERSTGWADYARASIVGMSLDTEPVEILRAVLEAVAYRFADVYELLREELFDITGIIASGGGLLRSAVWTQMMADAIGVPIVASAVPEASSRGAALIAFHALGHIHNLSEVTAPTGEVYEPNAQNHERYEQGRKRQRVLYERLIAPGPDALAASD